MSISLAGKDIELEHLCIENPTSIISEENNTLTVPATWWCPVVLLLTVQWCPLVPGGAHFSLVPATTCCLPLPHGASRCLILGVNCA